MIKLNANGADIPAIGFGTWQLKGAQAADMVARALAAGYRHIDTAIMYDNAEGVGDGIRASGVPRDEIFLTSKVWPTDVREDAFANAVQGELDRLDVDQLDLLLIHWPPKVGDEALWARLLNEVADRGWTKHIGVSNFTTSQLDAMTAASPRPIACNQVENHPYLDQSKLRAKCAEHGVALIAYCPLFQGRGLLMNERIGEIAKAHGRSPAQIVLRWHVQHEGSGAIPKTATPERLAENIAVFDFELSAEEMAEITAMGSRHERICDFEFSPVWDAA